MTGPSGQLFCYMARLMKCQTVFQIFMFASLAQWFLIEWFICIDLCAQVQVASSELVVRTMMCVAGMDSVSSVSGTPLYKQTTTSLLLETDVAMVSSLGVLQTVVRDIPVHVIQ